MVNWVFSMDGRVIPFTLLHSYHPAAGQVWADTWFRTKSPGSPPHFWKPLTGLEEHWKASISLGTSRVWGRAVPMSNPRISKPLSGSENEELQRKIKVHLQFTTLTGPAAGRPRLVCCLAVSTGVRKDDLLSEFLKRSQRSSHSWCLSKILCAL